MKRLSNFSGPLGEGMSEFSVKIITTDSYTAAPRPRRQADKHSDSNRDDNKQAIATLWSDFHTLAVRNVTASYYSAVPSDAPHSYLSSPLHSHPHRNGSPNHHTTRALDHGDMKILDLGPSSVLTHALKSITCDTTQQSNSPGKGKNDHLKYCCSFGISNATILSVSKCYLFPQKAYDVIFFPIWFASYLSNNSNFLPIFIFNPVHLIMQILLE